jgi:predicted tellurium resistance membrane protein TerC
MDSNLTQALSGGSRVTVRTNYRIANLLLWIALAMLAVRLLGMAGVIPMAREWRGMAMVAVAMLFVARVFRRAAQSEETAAKNQSLTP